MTLPGNFRDVWHDEQINFNYKMALTFGSVVLGIGNATLCMASCIITTTKSNVIPHQLYACFGAQGLFLNLINRDTDKTQLVLKKVILEKLSYNSVVAIMLKRVKRRV